jgi:hypothetical protein
MGQADKANRESELFKKISAEKKRAADQERREIPQFVYTLGGKSAAPQSPPSNR